MFINLMRRVYFTCSPTTQQENSSSPTNHSEFWPWNIFDLVLDSPPYYRGWNMVHVNGSKENFIESLAEKSDEELRVSPPKFNFVIVMSVHKIMFNYYIRRLKSYFYFVVINNFCINFNRYDMFKVKYW